MHMILSGLNGFGYCPGYTEVLGSNPGCRWDRPLRSFAHIIDQYQSGVSCWDTTHKHIDGWLLVSCRTSSLLRGYNSIRRETGSSTVTVTIGLSGHMVRPDAMQPLHGCVSCWAMRRSRAADEGHLLSMQYSEWRVSKTTFPGS